MSARRGNRSRTRRPPKPSRKVTVGPDTLAILGPLLPVECFYHPAFIEHATSLKVSSPIPGVMLVDTGATRTCVSQAVADDLGLMPSDTIRSHGAHGFLDASVYPVTVDVTFPNNTKEPFVMSLSDSIMAIKDLENAIPDLELDGVPTRVIGLLGRDFLKHVIFEYHGPFGRFVIRPSHID